MRQRVSTEININHERWLVSYADFVTLLFAFFVVMYSISQVSESKYRVLSETMTQIFNEPKRSLEPIQVGEISRSGQPTPIAADGQSQKPLENEGAFNKTADLPQLSDQFSEQFADLIDDKVVQVNSNEYWLQLSLNNSILFSLGSVQPKVEAKVVLEKVADLLRNFNNPIQVEGYTDNLAVNSIQFPSNWELSSARAAAVVKILSDSGIAPQRLAAVGYGEYHPIAENSTPEGRAQNRRVVLMIAREKLRRPQVSTKAAIEAAVVPQGREQTQVNPQPGLENAEPINPSSSEPQSLEEKVQRLVEENPALGLETVLKPQAEKPEETPAEPLRESETEAGNTAIKPVETKSGGLLFSSDPDLPRKE